MKNLKPLTRKISYWDGIVVAKKLTDRKGLIKIRPIVLKRFSTYYAHCKAGNMEHISSATFSVTQKRLLNNCYAIKTKGLSKLKKAITDNQVDILKSECQYCNIGEPTTFDHYMPKGKFPEFSVLSNNLIPCCFQCNLDKGEKWLKINQRRFINLYYDNIPIVKYLEAKIYFKRMVPFAKFTLNTGKLTKPFDMVISNHFQDLELLKRYQERSGGVISDLLKSLAYLADPKRRKQVKSQLKAEADGIRNDRGKNYWRAAVIDACSESEQFLDLAGY